MTINGASSGTGYDQLIAGGTGGTVNLASATLNVSTGSFNPTPGSVFTILHNTSGSAIVGTFDYNGQPLAEGGRSRPTAMTSRSATRAGPTART